MADIPEKPKPEFSKFFWNANKTSPRGQRFWVDIETTGLGKQTIQLGPDEFKKTMDSLKSLKGADRIEAFKRSDIYKYFEEVGLAQLVTRRRTVGPAPGYTAQRGIPRWEYTHGAGYSIWGDTLPGAMDSNIAISEFARKRGIIGRSVLAFEKGEGMTEKESITRFAKTLVDLTKRGQLSITGQNIWFDISAIQSFLVRHAGTLEAAGYDPLFMFNQLDTGALSANSVEETYFDLLRWKGLANQQWGNNNLKYGKMAATVFNRQPGSPINLVEDAARRLDGKTSHLRARFGWKQDIQESIFTRYMGIGDLKKAVYPRGIPHFTQLSAHDALRDLPVAWELHRRQRLAGKLIDNFEKNIDNLQKAIPGVTREDLSALAFAKVGFLGKQYQSKGFRLTDPFIQQFVTDPEKLSQIRQRAEQIWTDIGGVLKKADELIPQSNFRIITGQYGSYRRVFWPKDFDEARRSTGGVRDRAIAVGGSKILGVKNWYMGLPKPYKIGVGIAATAGILSFVSMMARSNDVDSNEPYDYIRGQQGNTRAIKVPWGSPYQDPSADTSTAIMSMIAGSASIATTLAVYNAPRVMKPEWQIKSYALARTLEDITPFRIGRLFNLSGFYSSYMPMSAANPNVYSVQTSTLVDQMGNLTPMGRGYARAYNVTDQRQFANTLLEFGDSIRFQRAGKGPWSTMILPKDISVSQEAINLAGKKLRFFESLSRMAKSVALYGADASDVEPIMTPIGVQKRLSSILYGHSDPRLLGNKTGSGIHRALRFLYEKVPFGRNIIERYANIPRWDSDPFKFAQKTDMAGTDVLVPGYTSDHKGRIRFIKSFTFEYLSSGYGLLRNAAALFGANLGPATSLRQVGKRFAGAGAIALGVVGGAKYLNSVTNGVLFAPFYNIYERSKLLQAKISDTLGLTDIRKRNPDVPATAGLAIPLTGALAYGLTKWFMRARHTPADYHNVINSGGINRLWGRLSWGSGLQGKPAEFSFRERPFRRAGLRASSAIRRTFTEKYINKLGRISRKLTLPAKAAVVATGVAAALFAPFLFGTKYTEEEYRDIFAGKREVEIRRGRWWEFSATPYEGGRVAYFRPHRAALRKIDAEEATPGSEGSSVIRSLFDPYWRERDAYHTRPYPITSAPLYNIPLIGPLLAKTIGSWWKPPLTMHTNEWQPGMPYQQYSGKLEPNMELGGLPPQEPSMPYGIKAQLREGTYRPTEFAGFRGFLTQVGAFQDEFGGSAAYSRTPFLQPSRLGGDFTTEFYEAEMGGMLGTNELFRRFFPRNITSMEVNPLRNQMPSWIPGEEYFINFKQGDPYNKIPFGEARLPGPGFAERFPELEGVAPEDYPAWARYKILADIAPWARNFRSTQTQAFNQAAGNPEMEAYLEEIKSQVDVAKQRKDFKEHSFLRDMESINGRITDVTTDGTFTLAEYPYHEFKFSGLNFGLNASANQIARLNEISKKKAVEKAANRRDSYTEKLREMLVGESVSLSIPQGGLSKPSVDAIVYNGMSNINQELAEEGIAESTGGKATAGFISRIYGSLVEGIGHAPQYVPGPWMAFTKLNNQADPIEEYARSELYGSPSRLWNKPWQDFLRPYFYQTISKLTPGEFTPPHVEQRRDTETLFDRIKFMKAYRAGNLGEAGRTAAGMDVFGEEDRVKSALPYRDRPYFETFAQETDPERRERILSMVSDDMQRALQGQWTRQYANTIGAEVQGQETKARMELSFNLSEQEIRKAGYNVPDNSWIGWDKRVDTEDVKAIFIKQEGMDLHDYNIWDDRMNQLLRKPYLKGADEMLTSRPMRVPAISMSRGLDRRRQEMHYVSEEISRGNFLRFNMHNRVDHSQTENNLYNREREKLLGR